MDIQTINILLEKYWNCQTSVVEEQELQQFFNSGNVPEELQQFVPLFAYKKTEKSVEPSADFEQKLQNALAKHSQKAEKYITIKIFAPMLRIAAAIVIIAGVGIMAMFIAKQNEQAFAETYNDPSAAIEQASLALEKLSSALKISEEASMKTLEHLNDLDVDWSLIDSLSSDMPVSENVTEDLIDDENL